MEPITLATVSAAAGIIGSDAVKGFAGEAGKDVWRRLKTALGLKADPTPQDLPHQIAARLTGDEAVARRVLDLLHSDPASAGLVQQVVGTVNTGGGQSVVVGSQTAGRDMHNNFGR